MTQQQRDTEKIEKKRRHEMEIMELMVSIYCSGNRHKGARSGVLCPDCQELLDYALVRTGRCPFMADKTFCSACKVHCYAPAMRERVRLVMKYAGPRMMLHHPIIVIHHCLVTIREVRAAKRKEKHHVS